MRYQKPGHLLSIVIDFPLDFLMTVFLITVG